MHLLKKINLALVLTLVLPPFLPLLLARESLDDPHYEEQAKQKMAEGVRKNLAAYDAVEGSLEAGPVTVRTRLGETVSDAGDGVVYDGIRFTAPKDLKGKDFVIYINVPSSWYNRYLMPVSGDFDEGFRNWMNADCLYQDLDRAEEKDRQRNFHMLGGSFFKPGMEYVLWFRRAKNGDRQEGELRAVIAFVPQSADEIRFDTDSMESALKLKRASAADQVKFLNSRGGRAMLDKDLFDPLDAKDRIDDVIAGIRASFRGRVGLFVTEEKIFPLCKKSPKMSEVRARYGAPDCIISDAEWKRVLDYAGREPEEDVENMVQHFYDYFAFNTAADDPEAHVKRVRTHSSDFAISNEFKKGDFMWQVPLKNLTLFYHNRKEVGRMYFFMDQTEFRIEKERKPLVIQEPPVGKYKIDEASVLNYEGGGKWQWLTHKGDKVVREFPLENHMLHGMGEGFHDNGKPSFLVPYLNGRANGEATLMNE